MKETIKQIFEDDADGITFLPMGSAEEININGFFYSKKSKFDKHDLGYRYHIVIYKIDENGDRKSTRLNSSH